MVRWCVRCTISSMRPRISFDEEGVCSACRFAEKKAKTNWEEREVELQELCHKYRSHDGSFDVVVPVSGGKDGGFVAHQLKYVYGMNPLCVSFAPLIPTEIGQQNLRAFINSGFDVIQGHPNGQSARKLARLAFEFMGDPFQPFIYGQTNFPLQVAVRYRIPLIMYGENGEVEYGGDMKNANRPDRDLKDHAKHYFSGISPEWWTEHGISEADLKPFMAPTQFQIERNETRIHFMGYYKRWDPQENYYYCAEHTGFSPNTERSEGTYSKYASLDDCLDGFHYYLGYIKFGIGRATSDAAHEIRDGKITREEGIALVRKFDGEFPKRYYKDFLEYCSMDEEKFEDVVNSWRPAHIWEHDGKWELIRPIWRS